jgi:hypothetical protein
MGFRQDAHLPTLDLVLLDWCPRAVLGLRDGPAGRSGSVAVQKTRPTARVNRLGLPRVLPEDIERSRKSRLMKRRPRNRLLVLRGDAVLSTPHVMVARQWLAPRPRSEGEHVRRRGCRMLASFP